jgi:hypothetical protein
MGEVRCGRTLVMVAVATTFSAGVAAANVRVAPDSGMAMCGAVPGGFAAVMAVLALAAVGPAVFVRRPTWESSSFLRAAVALGALRAGMIPALAVLGLLMDVEYFGEATFLVLFLPALAFVPLSVTITWDAWIVGYALLGAVCSGNWRARLLSVAVAGVAGPIAFLELAGWAWAMFVWEPTPFALFRGC